MKTTILSLSILAYSLNLMAQDGPWAKAKLWQWDESTQQVKELNVLVFDEAPERNRRVSWTGGFDGEMKAEGEGRLEWREKNAPEYGTEGLLAIYEGQMKSGQPHGEGEYRAPDGLRYEGAWENGRFHGEGTIWFADGELYEGEFRDGQRHGEGRTVLPTGESYRSEWVRGTETAASAQRREEAATETGANVRMGIVASPRKIEEFRRRNDMLPAVFYTARYTADGLYFEPDGRALEAQKPGGQVAPLDGGVGSLFLELNVENEGDQPVVIQGGEVRLESSKPDLEPLIFFPDYTGYMAFSLMNAGWGPAENATLEYSLVPGHDAKPAETFDHRMDVGRIHDEVTIDIEPALRGEGVKTDFIQERRYELGTLVSKDNARDVFGRFARFAPDGELNGALVTFQGRLNYDWTDADGNRHSNWVRVEQYFELYVMAEGGSEMPANAGFDVSLQTEGQDYRIPFPLQVRVPGGRVERFSLDLTAEKSSYHTFKVVLNRTDGGTVESPLCRFRYFKPRAISYESGLPWIFSDSDARLLSDGELKSLTKEELWRARNEIFVRHGYTFNSDKGKAFVAEFGDYYYPSANLDEVGERLSEIEKRNIEKIKEYENK